MKAHIITLSLAATICVALLNGCSTDKTDKGGTPIASGLYQVGRGIAGLRMGELDILTNQVFVSRGETNYTVGLFATDFSYTFNVSSSKFDSNTLTIAAAVQAPNVPASLSASDAYSAGQASARANTITLNFASPFFTTTTVITTNKTTVGSNTTTTVETQIKRSITDPKKLQEFFNVVYGGTNGFASHGGHSGAIY